MSNLLLTFAIPEGTGASRMLVEYALALRARGHKVILAHGDSTANSPVLPESGLRILNKIKAAGVICVECQGYRSLFSGKLQRQLLKLADEFSIDAVIGFQQLDRKYALSLSKKRKIPCVIAALNKHTFWGPKPVAWLKRLVYTKMIRSSASLVVCSSEEVQREILNDFQISKERTTLITNGLRMHDELLGPATRQKTRDELGIASDEIVMINIGRIDIQKGQDILLAALAELSCTPNTKLPRWRLLLVGDVSAGPNASRMQTYSKKLRAQVEDFGLSGQVTFLGWRDDLRELLTASDIYVHPSRWEGWPLAILHAMGEAKPIVASDCVGTPEGFESGVHGFMFKNEDVMELTACLQHVLSCDNYEAMGNACRIIARKNYDIATLSRRFVEAVESTID